ncbi:hypothetical protein DE146DRAFT_307293 [Phaeosphaeria sp. MPI-PUGE-AT-0046c]|nr:hypothetical protein DE146DRAFT_307293 [Phaeosphaeria sp. MPI-PUGE-AT-0046c]
MRWWLVRCSTRNRFLRVTQFFFFFAYSEPATGSDVTGQLPYRSGGWLVAKHYIMYACQTTEPRATNPDGVIPRPLFRVSSSNRNLSNYINLPWDQRESKYPCMSRFATI